MEQEIPVTSTLGPEPVVIPQPQSKKTKDNSKVLGDDAVQIITGYHPNPNLECKEREKFQAVVEEPPDSFTTDALAVKEHLTNFINPLHIKDFKKVKNPDGTCKMIAYFENWEDLRIYKISLVRNHFRMEQNSVGITIPCHLLLVREGRTVSGLVPIGKINLTSQIKIHLLNVSKLAQDPNQTEEKNKKSQKMKDKSTGTSFPKKLSKRQLHIEIVKLKIVLMDFI
ncbi:hypothetical protein GLOIN_2v1774607 [Rhizophagus clarus]|uniref:Uncharacterized protein n=1 Tax=Rhizophagus clarus TaxID=94130 RepID=A0A8H3LMR5_9GLOM|nr:hypothetical protein GLOIN_2v1774607 [Rhizophagus clarus]